MLGGGGSRPSARSEARRSTREFRSFGHVSRVSRRFGQVCLEGALRTRGTAVVGPANFAATIVRYRPGSRPGLARSAGLRLEGIRRTPAQHTVAGPGPDGVLTSLGLISAECVLKALPRWRPAVSTPRPASTSPSDFEGFLPCREQTMDAGRARQGGALQRAALAPAGRGWWASGALHSPAQARRCRNAGGRARGQIEEGWFWSGSC